MTDFAKPSERLPKVHLYKDPSSRTLDVQEIARYLREKFGKISVDIREPLITTTTPEMIEKISRNLASTRVRDLMDSSVGTDPLPGEIEFERKLLRDPGLRLFGVLYDGVRLLAAVGKLLPPDELDMGHVHVVFTNRLFGTWDEGDRRYHARVSIYGFPSLISTTGIVEAPAKPKEYYALKQGYAALGVPVPLEELREKFRGEFIDYDDERLTEVMKGYVMQALFYHLFQEPFCDRITCKLYNSHWQEEVIKSQLECREKEFCDRHHEALNKLRQNS